MVASEHSADMAARLPDARCGSTPTPATAACSSTTTSSCPRSSTSWGSTCHGGVMRASSPDFLTVDAFARPPGGRIRWRRNLRRVIDDGIDGLRGVDGQLRQQRHPRSRPHARAGRVPRSSPPGSRPRPPRPPSQAHFARAIDGPGRFSLDGEVVAGPDRLRVRAQPLARMGTVLRRVQNRWPRTSPWWPSCTASFGVVGCSSSSATTCTRPAVRPTITGTGAASTSPPSSRSSTPRSACGGLTPSRRTLPTCRAVMRRP